MVGVVVFFFNGVVEEWDFIMWMKRTAFVSKLVLPQTVPFLQLPLEQKCANCPIFTVSSEVQLVERFFGWLIWFSLPFFLFLFLIQAPSLTLKPVLQRWWLGFTVFMQTWTLQWAWICPENKKIYFCWTGLKMVVVSNFTHSLYLYMKTLRFAEIKIMVYLNG